MISHAEVTKHSRQPYIFLSNFVKNIVQDIINVHIVIDEKNVLEYRLGLWCLMPFSTIFQLYRGVSVLLMEEIREPRENH